MSSEGLTDLINTLQDSEGKQKFVLKFKTMAAFCAKLK